MNKTQQTKKFEEIISSLGFQRDEENDYFRKYKKNTEFVLLFFGRYSEKPDIFVRFEDGETPEQFSVSSMMFIEEVEKGINTLVDLDGDDRLNHLIKYFAQNSSILLEKSICLERKKAVEKYLEENF